MQEIAAHVHGAGEGVHHQSGHNSASQAANQDESLANCECCDGCVSMCVGSGGSIAAIVSALVPPPLDGPERLIPRAVDFRLRPPPQSLFRPPIPQA